MSRNDLNSQDNYKLTSGDLRNILDINKKAIEIHIEVEKQYEEMLEILQSVKNKTDEIDKALFRLLAILGAVGVGTLISIIKLLIVN